MAQVVATTDDNAEMGSEQRFRNRPAEAAIGSFFAVLVLVGFGGLASGHIQGAGFCAVGAAGLVRAFRSSDVTVTASGVRTRSIVRTRVLPFEAIRKVEIVTGSVGLLAYRREYLAFHRTDESCLRFTEFNAKPSTGDKSSVVRAAANCINARLAR